MDTAENRPLISIIIPVYNVGEYLDECLTSVCAQTYPRLEILLVDDGSTDGCGALCDAWAAREERIRVIHKENGGLSDARNAGLAEAAGDYIGYVDSDDTIAPDMYETLYDLCREHEVPIACARFDLLNGAGASMEIPPDSGECVVLSGEEYLRNIITYNVKRSSSYAVWTRLYRRDAVEGLRFPKGKNYEDICYTTEAVLRAGSLVYLSRFLYHYRWREGSISHTTGTLDRRLITDRMTQRAAQLHIMEEQGRDALAALARAKYYPELLSLAAQNPYTEYDGLIRDAWEDFRPDPKRIWRLPLSVGERLRLYVKAKHPGRAMRRYRKA